MTPLAALLVALCGLAIGATSIGGVLVVPALNVTAGIPVDRAVAAASFGFLFPGVAAAMSPPAEGPGRHGALLAGALAGAALGALTLAWLTAGTVRTAVALLCIGSGLYALVGLSRGAPVSLPPPARLLLGAMVGCASAWSGTGGPVVLLPLLALLGWAVTDAVAAAQRVQLPVAIAATAVHLAAGRLDLLLGTLLGVLLLIGWTLGRRLATRLPVRRLQQLVAAALIAAGAAYL